MGSSAQCKSTGCPPRLLLLGLEYARWLGWEAGGNYHRGRRSAGGIPALGLCRCQSCWRTVDTNIKTHDDLIALRSIVDTAPCGGLADEITVIAIAPNRERDYAPKYLFASGTCKQGDQSRDSAVMLETIFEVWNSDPRGYEQRGPCPVVWSDGGGGILKGAHSVLAKEILPMQHPLHGPLTQMLLFNKHLKVYGKTATSDGSEQKHNFKRSKEAAKSEKREWRTHGPSSFTLARRATAPPHPAWRAGGFAGLRERASRCLRPTTTALARLFL